MSSRRDDGTDEVERSARRPVGATLPPPEWVPEKRADTSDRATPARRTGVVAEEGTLRARLRAAKAAGDAAAERRAQAQLARWLAMHERDLDEAVELARDALRTVEDTALRREVAAWLEGLGDPALAAAELARLVESDEIDHARAVQLLLRTGALRARAGDSAGAVEAFQEAARLDVDNPLPLELAGAVGGWASDDLPRAQVAGLYLEAAERNKGAGELEIHRQDLARSLEADPACLPAAALLAESLREGGRPEVADEVMRACAGALAERDREAGRRAHEARVRAALADADGARAACAALDGDLDGALAEDATGTLDGLLTRLGLFEVLAVRLERRARQMTGPKRLALLLELGRLWVGPLAAPERGRLAYEDALAADPANREAHAALRALAEQANDAAPLRQALVRAVLGGAGDAQARHQCARQLAALAAERASLLPTQVWAFEQARALDPGDLAADEGARAHAGTLDAMKEEVALTGQSARSVAGDARADVLRVHVELLGAFPGRAGEYAEALGELCDALPDDAELRARALEASRFVQDWAAVAAIARAGADRAKDPAARAALRVELARALALAGNEREALEAALAALSEAPRDRVSAALVWALAAAVGDREARAEAVARAAEGAPGQARSALVAWAADQLFAAGRADEGRALAEQACQSDTHGLRAVVALANVSVGSRTQAGAAALERAIATTTPRSEWCRALGDALEELGRVAQAVAWTHRALTLRPGDAELLRAFFRRATAARDADRIAEAVDWALTQPVPARIAVEVLPAAFEALVELDRPRAGLLARRALDAFGPRHAGLRAAILAAAAAARDDALACTALERWIAAGAPVRDRASLYTSMAAYASAAGDHDGEARALARALREGAAREQVAAGIASLLKRDLGPDGELALCEARVLAAQADPADASEAAMALRLLGAARWDVAGDTVGAVEAWVEGAKLAGDRGVAMLGADLTRFGGHALAGSTLEQLAASVSDPERKAQTLAEAARASLAGGDAEHALALARGALDASPSCGSALEVAEQASVVLGRGAGMSLVYDEVAARALGRFGRRAAHHRGARFFEQNGEAELALKHAAAAFKAVPAEGTTFTMLARAARRAHGHAAAVAAIESVADDVRDSARKAGWLLRAAQVSGLDEEGARRRFDLLTRAALLSPDAATLGLVADAARELLDLAPAQRDSVRTRIAETGKALGSKLDGPEGARVAVAFAELSITLFEDAVGGFDAVERALQADGDIDEFTRLEPLAASLAAASGAKEALARCMAIVERPYANIGVPALKLMAGVADELGDAALSTKALVAAAEKEPDDAALVARADHAALLLGDAPLSQRLDRRIPAAARVEALRAVAAERLGAGDATEAVALLERALTMAADPARAQIEDQLVKARAGRGEERPPSAPPVVPQAVAVDAHEARPWLEVAQEREERADLEGAVEAYERAAAHEPDALAAFEGLARVAEALDRGDVRITALQQLAVRLGGSERRAALRRLAEVHRVTGDEERAASILRKLLAHVPEDEEADAALEAIVASHGDAAELAEYLAGRVERLMGDPERKEVLRVVRLRRAALLEQRLGLVDAARTELETVVREWPEHDAAMSYLADLYDRTGEPERAVKLWQKLAERADDPQRRMDLQMRLANGLYAMGEPRLVLEVLRTVTGSNPAHEEALRLRADVARDVGDDLELGDALDALSGIVADDAITRSDMLVEAAQAAARGGDSSLALARARRAARLTPDHGAAQLFARGMEYRTRGAGAPDDARQTIEELARVEGTLEPEDAALATFLVAEALDALQGGSAGMQRLVDAYEEIGPQPLLCLGLAERLVVQGRFDEALPFFERALAGNLLGLRAVDRVALAAADAARRTGNEALAAKLEGEPDAEEGAEEEEAPPRVEVPDLDEPLPATEGRSSAPPAERDRRSSAPPPASGRAAVTAELTPRDLERAVAEATTREARAKARLSLAHVHQARGDVEAAESLLWEAVGDGSAECADELGDLLERDSARAAELVKVRRHAVELAPGDTLRLDRLRRAALADQHNVYARALDHVLRAFDAGAGPLPPPPLSVQVEQPGMLSLLARHSHEPANEAMGVVWDAGSAAFARSMSSYALTGLERVVPGPATVLGRLYEVTVRLLDLPRIPLFVRRAMGRLSASVALLSPPSAVLTGETRDDTTELRYVLGQALAAALPQNVLVLGLPEADARIAWNALLGGFGPTEYSKALDHVSGPVAETLWQMVPARAQKQLKDLMQAGGRTDFELLVERARQTGRRLGMFLTGDFRFAARALLGEYVNADPEDLDRPGALAGYCSQFPSLADLYRLAVRPEYADARWHPVPVASQRGTISSGRFSLV